MAVAQTPPPALDPSGFIRTPVAPKTPRINGPCVYGERPGRPFLYHLPVTGDRPLAFYAEGLPPGLSLDKARGNITGTVAQSGTFAVKFTVKNGLGENTKTISLVIGQTISLTPPMGWNSWNCFGPRIDETKIRAAADAMVKSGLIDHGWTYINMDDKWEGLRAADGRIQGGPGFPDIKGMADYIHGLGLKVGLYSSPGPITCAGAVASYQHEEQDAQTYGDWTIDYLKYDWCSYQQVITTRLAERYAAALPDSASEIKQLAVQLGDLQAKAHGYPPYPKGVTEPEEKKQINTGIQEASAKLVTLYQKTDVAARAKIGREEFKAPYVLMRSALDKVNRDIVYSFCQYGYGSVWEWGAESGGNTWRTTNDIQDNWKRMVAIGFAQNGLEKYAGPGHWNDPDMLEVGNGSLTPDENYTHMTLWCILSAPLLIGCDMTKMNPFVTSLYTNDEVIAVNQDSLGKQGSLIKRNGDTEVWSKSLDDGSLAVAFFNRGDAAVDVAISWTDLGLKDKQPVRDLWRQKDMGAVDAQYSVNVASHGAELFKIGPGM